MSTMTDQEALFLMDLAASRKPPGRGKSIEDFRAAYGHIEARLRGEAAPEGQAVAYHIQHPDGLVALRKREAVDEHMVEQAAADGIVIRPLVFADNPQPAAPAPVAGEAVRGTDAWRYQQICRLIDAGDSSLDNAIGDAYNMGAGALELFLDGLHVPVADIETALAQDRASQAGAAEVPKLLPVAFSLRFSDGSVNAMTTFATRDEAESYADKCTNPPEVVPLYTCSSATPNLSAERKVQ